MTMKEELAALKKKFDAGKLTKFKYNQGVKDIKKNYGKATPSNVGRIINFISAKVGPAMTEISPRSAKAVAAKKAAGLANRGKSQGGRTAAEDKKARPATKNDDFLAGLNLNKEKKEKRAAPKFNPSGLKVPAKKKAAAKKTAAKSKTAMYHPLNPKTGKADTSKPKVSVAVRLKQEDRYKSRKMVETAAKSSMKKKKRG